MEIVERGSRLTRARGLKPAFGLISHITNEIEDLWMVQRHGSLLRAAASASLPGFAEPALEGKTSFATAVARQPSQRRDAPARCGYGDRIRGVARGGRELHRGPGAGTVEVLRRRAQFPTLMDVVLGASSLHSTRWEQFAPSARP